MPDMYISVVVLGRVFVSLHQSVECLCKVLAKTSQPVLPFSFLPLALFSQPDCA